MKEKLDYEPESFPIADDHLILRFKTDKDCSLVLERGLWFVAGQLLTMERWEPDFVPSRRPNQKTVVWMRLPGLPLEYRSPQTIMAIAAEAGKPLAIDDFTELPWKTRYARIRVKIDAAKPLKPGVLIKGRNGIFWQQFVYENLPLVCY